MRCALHCTALLCAFVVTHSSWKFQNHSWTVVITFSVRLLFPKSDELVSVTYSVLLSTLRVASFTKSHFSTALKRSVAVLDVAAWRAFRLRTACSPSRTPRSKHSAEAEIAVFVTN
jgi:hypothetical protein